MIISNKFFEVHRTDAEVYKFIPSEALLGNLDRDTDLKLFLGICCQLYEYLYE